MQLKRFLLMIALLTGAAFAQTTSTITGTIKDLTGALVTSGKITFTLRPSADATMSGIARFTGQTVTCLINGSGLVKALDGTSACVITMNTALQPAGSGYLVSFWPGNVKTATIFMYAISASIDITTVVSTQAQLPSIGGVVDTFTNQTIGGNKTFTGTTTISGPSAITAPAISSPVTTGTDNGAETLQNKSLTGPSNGNTVSLLNFQGPLAPVVGTGSLATIYSYTIPANTLAVNKGVWIRCAATHSTGSASVAYQENFGATSILANNSAAVVGAADLEAWVYATGASSEVSVNNPNLFGGVGVVGVATPAESLAGGITVNCQFNVAATDQVTPKLFAVSLLN